MVWGFRPQDWPSTGVLLLQRLHTRKDPRTVFWKRRLHPVELELKDTEDQGDHCVLGTQRPEFQRQGTPHQYPHDLIPMVQCHLTTSTLLGHKRDRTSHLPIFWDSKRPLVNRDTLALPLKEGGFNIPRLETKIQALRVNTIKRLLSGEQAHWKSFTAHFFSISNIRPGKLALAMDYKTDQIDWNIPAFHKELLSAWHKYAPIRPAQIYPSLLLMSLSNLST